MKLNILLIICLVFVNFIYAQQDFKGIVLNNEEEKVEYFNVQLYLDTLDIKKPIIQGSFVDGIFSLKVPESDSCIIKISSLGYKTKKFRFLTKELNNRTITFYLEEKVYSLNPVTISAIKPKISKRKNSYVMSVQNTSLSNESSISKVISKMPFVLLDVNNKISIAGKDKVSIYVNGRKINYEQELQSISPTNISEVELITEPGAKFDANSDAVILIKTKKNKNEGMTLSLKSQAVEGNRFSYKINPNVIYKHKKVNLYFDYVFSNLKGESKENTFSHNLNNSSLNNIYNLSNGKTKNHTYTLGLDYQLNKRSNIVLQFLGWNENQDSYKNITNNYQSLEDTSLIETVKNINSKQKHYDGSVNYNVEIAKKQKLTTSFDYAIHKTSVDEFISEYFRKNEDSRYKYDNNNKVFNFKSDYDWSIEKIMMNLSTGISLSYLLNNSSSLFSNNSSNYSDINNRFSNVYDFKEIIPAYFLDLNKKFKNMELGVGFRLENTTFIGNLNHSNVIDTTYLKIFPNLKINWFLNKNSRFGFDYIKKVNRPSFRHLSPSIRYDNTNFYRLGNPHLLPTISDDISLQYTFKRILSFKMGYRHKTNATVYNYYQDPLNSDITIVKLDNHKSAYFLYLSAFSKLKIQKFSSSNSFRYTKPFADLPYNNRTLKIRKPAIYLKSSNDYTINKNISTYIDFTYNDLGEILLEKKKEMYRVDLGISGVFFDRKLRINIAANDIFNTYDYRDSRSLGYYDVIHEYIPDNTFISMGVIYYFFKGKKLYKVRNNNRGTIKRL